MIYHISIYSGILKKVKSFRLFTSLSFSSLSSLFLSWGRYTAVHVQEPIKARSSISWLNRKYELKWKCRPLVECYGSIRYEPPTPAGHSLILRSSFFTFGLNIADRDPRTFSVPNRRALCAGKDYVSVGTFCSDLYVLSIVHVATFVLNTEWKGKEKRGSVHRCQRGKHSSMSKGYPVRS